MLSLRKKKNISQTDIYKTQCPFPDKVINFIDEPLVQYDVAVVQNTFVDNGDTEIVTQKKLIGILNVLFLEPILCIVLV